MTILATYRTGARNQTDGKSLHLAAKLEGDRVVFTGGKFGNHSVPAINPKAINAHWEGYCFNNNGGFAKPVRISAPKVIKALIAAQSQR